MCTARDRECEGKVLYRCIMKQQQQQNDHAVRPPSADLSAPPLLPLSFSPYPPPPIPRPQQQPFFFSDAFCCAVSFCTPALEVT